jgi:glycosyltransferase involved in cell wall biosynthesis
VNGQQGGIGSDWNFAYSLAQTDFVTLAHQDDYYEPEYTETVFAALKRCKNPIIVYTDYFEIRTEGRVYKNKLLRVKRMLNFPVGLFPRSSWIRRRMLSLGCALSCPSVVFNKKRFPEAGFDLTMLTDLDWQQWTRLSREKGEFYYLRKPLTGHRVYEQSTTSLGIAQGIRHREDLHMFCQYWPKGIAKFLMRFYSGAMKSNNEKRNNEKNNKKDKNGDT